MNLWLVHPDKSLRQALAANLRQLWQGIEINDYSPEHLPASLPVATIILADQPLPEVPAERLCLLDPAPLRLKVLVKRLEALLLHCYWPLKLDFQGAALNTRTREWCATGGQDMTLTEKEVGVMVYLWQQLSPVSREDLLRDVWHYAVDTDTHTIETHIYRLRQKIERDPAQPRFLVTGKDGYQLAARAKA